MRSTQISIGILNAMQVLDEMVALVRTIAEQSGDLGLRSGLELASLVE